MSQPKRVNVLEYAGGSKPHRVDREKGIIHEVKIIGHVSSSGRRYSPTALAEAKSLYEGARVNVNHGNPARPGEDRNFYDWFGALHNVRESQDGLYGELHYLKTHAIADRVCEAAERFPDKFGLSHDAVVMESHHDGVTVYNTISRVRSVDLVCKPGTTRGIFESEGSQAMDPSTPAEVAIELPVADSGDMTWEMFVTKAREIYDGEGDASSKAGQIGKLAKTLFKIQDQLEEVLNGSESEDPPSEDPPAGGEDSPSTEEDRTESAKDAELARLRRRDAARNVLESEGVPYGRDREIQITALAGLANDDARRKLARTWKSPGGVVKPRSTPANVLESRGDSPPPKAKYDDPKQAAAALMGRG